MGTEALNDIPTIAIVGNTNCGKTTLFNALTKSCCATGNWDGVTVSIKKSICANMIIVDTPGIEAIDDALVLQQDDTSLDKKETMNFLLHSKVDLLLYVADLTSDPSELYYQLKCLNIPIILIFNKADQYKRLGISLDLRSIEDVLHIKTFSLSSFDKKEVSKLKSFIINYIASLKIIKCDTAHYSSIMSDEVRYEDIENIFRKYILSSAPKRKIIDVSEIIDLLLLSRFFGIFLFAILMYLVFLLSVGISDFIKSWLELWSNVLLIEPAALLIATFSSSRWLVEICYYGAGLGVVTVASFLPLIFTLSAVMSILEESGYLTRASIVMDNVMHKLGLPGKAVIPLIIGMGCNVPAIMGVRALQGLYVRIITVMMMPFMVCGARFAIFAVFCSIFFKKEAPFFIFALYVTGISFAIVTGLIFKNILGAKMPLKSYMVIKLPDYRFPGVIKIFSISILRTKYFIKSTGKVILIICSCTYIISTAGLHIYKSSNNVDDVIGNHSLLRNIGSYLTYVTAPMGIKNDNWEAAIALFSGMLAKEVILGTLNSLYGAEESGEVVDKIIETAKNNGSIKWIIDRINFSLQTVTTDIKSLFALYISSENDQLRESSVLSDDSLVFSKELSLKIVLKEHFSSDISVFSYLLFILLYFPCISVFTATWNEIGIGYAISSAMWSTTLAYLISVVFYQITSALSNAQYFDDLCNNKVIIMIGLSISILVITVFAVSISLLFRKAERADI